MLYTQVTGAGLEKLSGGSTIFMNTQDSVFYMEAASIKSEDNNSFIPPTSKNPSL